MNGQKSKGKNRISLTGNCNLPQLRKISPGKSHKSGSNKPNSKNGKLNSKNEKSPSTFANKKSTKNYKKSSKDKTSTKKKHPKSNAKILPFYQATTKAENSSMSLILEKEEEVSGPMA